MDKRITIKWNKDLFNVYMKGGSNVSELKKSISNMTGIDKNDQKLIKSGTVLTDKDTIEYFEDGCVITLITSSNVSGSVELIKKEGGDDTIIEMSGKSNRENMGFNYTSAEINNQNGNESNFSPWFQRNCTKVNLALSTGICCILSVIVLMIIIKK
jgi:hypothetical protein